MKMALRPSSHTGLPVIASTSHPVMSSPRLTSLSSVSDAPPQGASGLLSPCMSRHWSGTMYASAGTCSLPRSPNSCSSGNLLGELLWIVLDFGDVGKRVVLHRIELARVVVCGPIGER